MLHYNIKLDKNNNKNVQTFLFGQKKHKLNHKLQVKTKLFNNKYMKL